LEAGIFAKEVKFLKLDLEVMNRAGGYAHVVGINVVVLCE
jgi:hypothetical protein